MLCSITFPFHFKHFNSKWSPFFVTLNFKHIKYWLAIKNHNNSLVLNMKIFDDSWWNQICPLMFTKMSINLIILFFVKTITGIYKTKTTLSIISCLSYIWSVMLNARTGIMWMICFVLLNPQILNKIRQCI